MTNVTNTNPTTENNYYNGVLYTRCFLNEVKLIQPKSNKAKPYCAVNATIISENDNGKKSYTTIDLIVKGDVAKKVLWNFNDQWPANRFEKNDEPWIADLNIGSLSHCAYEKRNGTPGAVLKGRLINIRSLKIGKDVVFGEMDNEMTNSKFVGPAYVNLVDVNKGITEVALLDGKIGEHNTQFAKLTFDDIEVFTEMESKDLCPKGYNHRETNPKVFAMLELSSIEAIAYKTKAGEVKSYLNGTLQNVSYLKANEIVLTEKTK